MRAFPYLAVDDFLETELASRSLALAFQLGLIDRLQKAPIKIADLPFRADIGRTAFTKLLASNNVVSIENDEIQLASSFLQVLPFRDLLEAKIAFCHSVSSDIANYLPHLLGDIQQFMAKSNTFQLFRYDRCFEITPENIAATRQWMRFTTALTRYEAQALGGLLDLSATRTLLDIGGNSGEFALQLCRGQPGLDATVFDLPVVCAIGREHVGGEVERSRVVFRAGDMRRDDFPKDFDLVTFKSVLHDWPDADARSLIRKAARSVRPGGRLLIFERAPMALEKPIPYCQMSNLVFLHFFRDPTLYITTLEEAGFCAPTVQSIPLEVDFNLIVATRKAC